MIIPKMLPKAIKNLINKQQSKKMISEISTKTLREPQISKESREYSLVAEQKLLQSEEYRQILKNAIRKAHAGGDDYKIGHTVPGLQYMAGNQYRTTLVFTLFFLPAWWAPWGVFCIMWMKQMGG